MADRAAASANSTVSVSHRPLDAHDGPGQIDDLADIINEVSLPADSREAIGTVSPARPPKQNRADRARPVASRFSLLVIRIVSKLSLAAAHRIGTVIGLLYSMVPGRMRDAGRANLRIAFPAMSDRELKRFARKCSVQAGRALLELPALWTWPGDRVIELVREVEGRELLDDAIARGKGIVVSTPHIGAWEMVVLWLGHSASLKAPFREMRLAELEDFVHAARQRTGTEMLPSQRFAARSLLRTLRDGGIVGMAPDQDAGSGGGVFVPLFHEVANTGVLIPRLVAKSGATMLWVFAERLEHGRGFRMHIEAADPESGSDNVVRGARAMNRDIESIVRRFPEQYLWFYRRYRRRPECCPRKVYTKSAWRIDQGMLGKRAAEMDDQSPTATSV